MISHFSEKVSRFIYFCAFITHVFLTPFDDVMIFGSPDTIDAISSSPNIL